MLIQYNKATSGITKPGNAFAPRKKSLITNGDFNKGIGGWTLLSGAMQANDGIMTVASTDVDGNIAQHLTNKLQPGWNYEITVDQIGGNGNGQWYLESETGLGDLYSSTETNVTESTIFAFQPGDSIWIRLKSIFVTGTEYCDFSYVRIKQIDPI